ncbi:LCP family protein required for cell wall assembly [Crossiella equi]|uniref:LCP family protein required for cell wall assembly n=1 Tax=Crossiella equi TaxID=130796 RepID=A0ABS5AA55_9PSEU|nr:LCP family protein [Crossiella equi]MBP2473461.1 LCP family protein required for cell wall assembly [Crossiella equi]
MGRRSEKSERPRTLGKALLLTLGATIVPGSGHLALRKRMGWLILLGFLGLIGAGVYLGLTLDQEQLLQYALSPQVLLYALIGMGVLVLLWVLVVLRTFTLARPRPMRGAGGRVLAGFVVLVLCAVVVTPFGWAAVQVNAQRTLLLNVFPTSGTSGESGSSGQGSGGDVQAIKKPRLNIMLVGSDAGPDRTGTRTDTMMVASLDTRSGQTVLFGLPRNLQRAQFPAGSPMARQFPNGFHDGRDPNSGEFLLNALYKYGNEHPQMAPAGPSTVPGLNLLHSSIAQMLGIELDYFIQVNMAGFASIIDALGGVDVNVGPRPIPINGLGPHGEQIRPKGWIQPGQQHLNGEQALWYGRARSDGSDYMRMSRQRCLVKYVIEQKSPLDMLTNFQAIASATQDNVSTNIPQDVLPALLSLAGKARTQPIQSISFDPNLKLRNGGSFSTAVPDFAYMREVVRNAQAVTTSTGATSTTGTSTTTTVPPTTTPGKSGMGNKPPVRTQGSQPPPSSSANNVAPPASLDEICSTDPSQSDKN